MVGGKEDNRIFIQPFLLQFIHQPPQILVQARALPQIIRILLRSIAAKCRQISGQNKVLIFLLRAFRPLIVFMVILVMRFDLGYGHEKRLLPVVPIQKF